METIIKNLDANKILLIEDFVEYLARVPLNENFIFILMHDEDRIVPTLSVKREKDAQISWFDNIEDIYSYFKIEVSKKYSEFVERISNKYLIFEEKQLSFSAIIIVEHDHNIREDYFQEIIKYHNKVAVQSLNRSNDFYKFRKKIRNDIEGFLDIDSSVFSQSLCSYFSKRYKEIKFYSMKYNTLNDDKWTCTNKCPLDIYQICNSFEKRITKERVSLAFKEKGYNYIIFPFISDLTENYLRDIIILKSQYNMPKYIIDNLRHIINYYYAVYLRDKKQELLDIITTKTKNLNQEVKNILEKRGCLDLNLLLSSDWLKKIFSEITLISNAHSVSLRLYFPYDKSLRRICEYSDTHIDANNSKDTSLYVKDNFYNKSQVVRAFVDQKIYYTQTVNKGNMKKFYILRNNTKSILTIPIQNEKSILGVLNYESLIENGLKGEKEYLKELANYISYFIKQFYFVCDLFWLTKRGNVYQNYHELENILRTEEGLSPNLKNKIKNLVEMMPIGTDENLVPIKGLKTLRDDFLSFKKKDFEIILPSFEVDAEYTKYKTGCVFNLHDKDINNIYVSEACLDILKVIYKNLLDNYNKYGKKECDTLAVDLFYDKIKHKVLNFTIISNNLSSFNKNSRYFKFKILFRV